MEVIEYYRYDEVKVKTVTVSEAIYEIVLYSLDSRKS